MRRYFARTIGLSLLFILLFDTAGIVPWSSAPLASASQVSPATFHTFKTPIRAISFGVNDDRIDLQVSALAHGHWSDWKRAEVDGDVSRKETSLIFFDEPTTHIRLRGNTTQYVMHPLHIDAAPARTTVATLGAPSLAPHILSRNEWGADDTFLFTTPASQSDAANGSNGENAGTVVSSRVADCEQAQQQYPDEFRTQRTVKTDALGRAYRWPLSYSKDIKLIVVHHTAMNVSQTQTSSVERMRALYAYHANSLGWGDVGYHYVIDENGQIYEGKAGGRYVVGGHAYCNNTGTIGVALMGNFENEQPTQKQTAALQWLVRDLAETYSVSIDTPVTFHGKRFSSRLVRHRDLLSTACPGYYLATAFPQIVSHVIANDVNATVTFPALPPLFDAPPVNLAPPTPDTSSSSPPRAFGLQAVGGLEMRMIPGDIRRFDLLFTAPTAGARTGSRLASIARSHADIVLQMEDDTGRSALRGALLLGQSLAGGDQIRFNLLVQAPIREGSYWFDIGGLRYSLTVAGRRSRLFSVPQSLSFYAVPASPTLTPFPSSVTSSSSSFASSTPSPSFLSTIRPSARLIELAKVSDDRTRAAALSSDSSSSPLIRVRLSSTSQSVLSFPQGGSFLGQMIASGESVRLSSVNSLCSVQTSNMQLSAPVVRFSPMANGLTSITHVRGATGLFRGVIECRSGNDGLMLINELPLEDYMKGLSEEPDSEPYEKQRAFAIAARTYASWYLDTAHRKFAGEPYDASDSPALFQSYTGVVFEQKNPRWLQAVSSTEGSVLAYRGALIKPPYFSSDDGRTRAPEEIGWKNFPFSQIFASKPDPWCAGLALSGHGVGMSGCGAKAQAKEGKSALQILQYYYPGTNIEQR